MRRQEKFFSVLLELIVLVVCCNRLTLLFCPTELNAVADGDDDKGIFLS